MMKNLTILVVVLCLVQVIVAKKKGSHKTDENWKNHARKNKLKFLQDNDESESYDNYLATDELINKHNNGNQTYKLGHNHLSHLNSTEQKKIRGHVPLIPRKLNNETTNKRGISTGFTIRGGYIYTPMQNTATFGGMNGYYYTPTPGYVPPASVNWIQRGFNKPVLNQGYCGNCYAFAALASIEGSLFARNKTSVTLSPQQITDCSQSFGNNGCDGGNAGNTYYYTNQNGGGLDSLYPYTSAESAIPGACQFSKVKGGPLYKVKTFYRSQPNSDAAVMEMLDKLGPLYVQINANDPFGFYVGGVYATTSGSCPPSTNHAVLLVGYGTDTTTKLPIWTIKNQWDTWWGVNGYMNLSRAIPNNCGISSGASFPLL